MRRCALKAVKLPRILLQSTGQLQCIRRMALRRAGSSPSSEPASVASRASSLPSIEELKSMDDAAVGEVLAKDYAKKAKTPADTVRRSQVPRGTDLEGYSQFGKDEEGENPLKLQIYMDDTSLLDIQREFDVEKKTGSLRFNPSDLQFDFMIGSKLVGRPDIKRAKVAMQTNARYLRLSKAGEKYAKEILGRFYDWTTGTIRFQSQQYDTITLNRRHCVEMLHDVCERAEEMAATLGDFEQVAPATKRRGWGKASKQRKRGRKPEYNLL